MKKIFTLIAAATLLAMSAGSKAALIEQDFSSTGDGLLILDTITGRQWVDVSHTTNIGGVTGFFTTSMFSGNGFQLANAANVTEFFTDAGAGNVLNGADLSFTSNNYAAATSLYALMELAPPFASMAGNPWIHGFISYSATQVAMARVGDGDYFGEAGNGSFNVGYGLWSLNEDVGGQVGIWAFRDTAGAVPEPGSLALLGLGVAGLGLARRRRKAAN